MKATLKIKNIKGQTKTVNLDRVNLITGKNGSGKSAILESLIVALDGEHPTAGKSLGAVCSMISGDTGEIELDATRGDAHINILRIFKRAKGNSQKIYINGKEEQQGTARSMIDDFLGGASARKISPYKFINLSPKERLSVLAEMLPTDNIPNIKDITKKTLYSGSEEVVMISRYTKKMPVLELSVEELEEVVREARKVDAEYLDLADQYIVPDQYNDAAAYVEALIEQNKADINEAQSEIMRLSKSLQSHQDALGDIALGDPAHMDSLEVLRAKRSEIEQKISDIERDMAKTKQAQNTLNNIQTSIDKIRKAHPNIDADIKKIKKEIAAFNKELKVEFNFDQHAAHMEINKLESMIEGSDKASLALPSLEKDKKLAEEQLVQYRKALSEHNEQAKKLSIELSLLKDNCERVKTNIDMLGEEDICPLCKSHIDAKALIKSLTETYDKLKEQIPRKKEELDKANAKVREAAEEEKDIASLINRYELAIKSQNEHIHSDDEISQAKARIDRLNNDLEVYQDSLKLQYLQSELDTLKARKESIKSLIEQAKKVTITPSYTQADLDACLEKRDEIDNMVELVQKTEAIKKMVASEQIGIDALKEKRSMLKKIGELLIDVKKQSYWFIDDISNIIKQVMGADGIINNSVFGISKDGIQIQDKVLSGGEQMLFIVSVLLGFAHLSNPHTAKILEIEGSELDNNNLNKIVDIINNYPEIDLAVITSHIDIDVDGVNHIRT